MERRDLIFYGEYAPKLEEIKGLLLTEIQSMLDTLGSDSETAVAEHIKCRIKGVDSLKEKLRRYGLEETAESGLRRLSDLIGVRVITHFVGDIYEVLDLIKSSPHWKVKMIKDYIANMKPNGYRSLHIILTLPFGVGGIDTIDAEVQLRTIAMDCWASLEHQLKYKKTVKNTSLIVDELKRCADEMASTDLTMQTIRDLIRKER